MRRVSVKTCGMQMRPAVGGDGVYRVGSNSKVSRGRQRKQRASARAQALRVPWTVESLVWLLMLS
eukprot:4253973-Prymnesium_polylepis.1